MLKNKGRFTFAALSVILFLTSTFSHAATLPSSLLSRVASALQRDFVSINEVGTYSLSDEADGRFDLVVIGSGRNGYQGWRVEVWSVERSRLMKRWDSQVSAQGLEFENSGPKSANVDPKEKDYDLLIEGCAQHMCSDGVSGFLLFSGRGGKTYRAKVVAGEFDGSINQTNKYDVTFSPGITDEAKTRLKAAICSSNAITNKHGLPFMCSEK